MGDVPDIDIVHMETPSPFTESGIKGMGESGIIGAPAAVVNAVLDALGAEPPELVLPLTPERIVALAAFPPPRPPDRDRSLSVASFAPHRGDEIVRRAPRAGFDRRALDRLTAASNRRPYQ